MAHGSLLNRGPESTFGVVLMQTNKPYIDIDEKLPVPKAALLGMQHFMSMFGGSILVPILIGFPPSITLMCSGIGTILYLLVTRGKIPSYLGPSFVFITPLITAAAICSKSELLSGVIAVGVIFVLISFLVKKIGTQWIHRFFPPVLVSSVIIVIALGLSGAAVDMAFLSEGAIAPWSQLLVMVITVAAAIFFSCLRKSFLSNISVLCGVVVGYVCAAFFGLIDFSSLTEVPWFGLPSFMFPSFSLTAIVLIAPVALILVVDHIGHLFIVGEVTGRDFTGILHRSLLGDGLATIVAGLCGAPPATTYAENMGVMSMTRVFASQIFWYAAGFAILVGGFCPKFEALISSIPNSVIGGVSIIIFGLIACNAMRVLISNKVDLNGTKEALILALVLIIGVGMTVMNFSFPIGAYPLPGFAVAMLIGFLLNILLPPFGGKKTDRAEYKALEEKRR